VTTTLYLHVGCPKSGTTFIQRILDHNRERLAEAGVLVVGDQHVDRVQAALQVREAPRWRELPPGRRDMWGRLVEQIRAWEGPTAVLSYELFSAATAEQAARALADLDGIDVHVVITARDLARSVASAWQERLKFGLTTSLEAWTPPPADDTSSEWGWRTTDPASVAERWGTTLPADHVHIVTMPRDSGADLWERFVDACDLGGIALDTALPRVNESLGAVEADLLRRINGRVRAPIQGSREQSRWMRDLLANSLLAARRSEGLGMTDDQFEEARERAEHSVATLAAAGYQVSGDLADLAAVRPAGRLPGEVTDGEALEAAIEVIVELLLIVRTEQTRPQEVAPQSAEKRVVAGRVAQRLARPYVRMRDAALGRRIAELEDRVHENRALHQRVAALQDVVTELLLPVDLHDPAVTRQALENYRAESM
jgi:hypothetical protein